jgi:hypothetical protein
VETELGEQPRPHIEPAEPNPGGVDAIEGNDHKVAPVVPDLFPDDNPGLSDAAPDELSEPEDSDQGASNDGASEPEKEAQA